jgi:ABC-2 type transport system permease protein
VNPVAYRLLLRSHVTRGRLLFALAAGVLVVLAGIGIAIADAPHRAATDLVQGPALGFLVPVISLIFAVAVLGDLAEDRTLVYVWLRPIARPRLAVSAFAAALTAVLPLTVIPAGLAAAVSGRPGLAYGAMLGAVLGASAYTALFLGLGLRTRRSLVWGLLYVLLWEDVLSNVSSDLATLSVRRYVGSILAGLGERVGGRYPVDLAPAIVTLVVVTILGIALCTWLLRRQDVD